MSLVTFSVGDSPGSEVDDEELTVFGSFDPDDPDFQFNIGTPPAPARSRSRLSGSRNSSSSSLRRIASNNSLGRQLSINLRQLSSDRIWDANGPIRRRLSTDDIAFGSNSAIIVDVTQCHTCGALWHQDQFSLDCDECGGAALTKACTRCHGNCLETWQRDVNLSHLYRVATWSGSCGFRLQSTSAGSEQGQPESVEDPGHNDALGRFNEDMMDDVVNRIGRM